jgi:hypothetical protein
MSRTRRGLAVAAPVERAQGARLAAARFVWACAALSAGAASAHHSIAAMYDTARQITLEGLVTEFQFVNPHPVLVIDAAKSGGAAERWRLELDNRSELVEIGVSAATFKAGDRIVATGSAGRNNMPILYAMTVERPADGLLYEQIGYSPRINRPRAR